MRDGTVDITLEQVEDPDVTLAGPPRPIMGLLLGIVGLGHAQAAGVQLAGDPAVLDRVGSTP